LRSVGIEARPIFITGFTDASIYNNVGIERAVVRAGGLTEEQVHDAVRIAATMHAAAVALEMDAGAIEGSDTGVAA
jgi:hypothetical protein